MVYEPSGLANIRSYANLAVFLDQEKQGTNFLSLLMSNMPDQEKSNYYQEKEELESKAKANQEPIKHTVSTFQDKQLTDEEIESILQNINLAGPDS